MARKAPVSASVPDKYQPVAVAEPRNLQGRHLVDEVNRAVQGAAWSVEISPLLVVTKGTVPLDGGGTNIFDPGNGYRLAHARIRGR